MANPCDPCDCQHTCPRTVFSLRLTRAGVSLLLGIAWIALTGCAPAVSHPRVSRELIVPEAPPVAYRRAVEATMALGGTIVQQDAQLHMLQAFVGGTTSLNVSVTPHGAGSRVEVAHQLLPTYFAAPEGRLAEEFLAAYQRQP
jgi:hypothetical protein